MATRLDSPPASGLVLRGALHGLVLAAAGIFAIIVAFAFWILLKRPAPQIVVQGALAALLTAAFFAVWVWFVNRLHTHVLAWRGRRDAVMIYGFALLWAPLVFVPLHLVTQGYLTSAGNLIALWLFQLPVNLLALWLASRISSHVYDGVT